MATVSPYAGYAPAVRYVPLGTRAMLACGAIVFNVVASFMVDGTQLAFTDELDPANPSLGAAMMLMAAGLALFLSLVLAAIFFGVFIHRAASNLSALGRRGMAFTPGWCVGWFYVPFANLWKPPQAINEVWRASSPDAAGDRWMSAPGASWLGAWWATWIIGGLLGNVSGRMDDPHASGVMGLAGSACLAFCAFAAIAIIRGIVARQDALARSLNVR